MKYSEIINSASDLLGWGQIDAITDTPDPATRKVVRAINNVLGAMQLDRDWPELTVRATLAIPGEITEEGIANISNGGTALTLKSTSKFVFSAADVGKVVELGGQTAHNTISTYIGPRSVTISSSWSGATVTNGTFTLSPRTEVGIANITKGSAVLTLQSGSATTFSAADVGSTVQIIGYPSYYTIVTYTNARSVVLDRVWANTSVALGTLFKCSMSFSLPSNYDRMLGGELTILETGGIIKECSPAEMRAIMRDNGVNILKEDAENYTVRGIDSSGNSLIHFDKAFPGTRSVEFSYQMKHPVVAVGASASDLNILYPDRLNLYLIDQVVAKLNRDVENNSMVQQQAADAYKEAVRANGDPATGRERVVMTKDQLRHGAYRRR